MRLIPLVAATATSPARGAGRVTHGDRDRARGLRGPARGRARWTDGSEVPKFNLGRVTGSAVKFRFDVAGAEPSSEG